MANKKIIALILVIILCACKENKIVTKDVLINRTVYVGENENRIRVDSIIIQYTDIDSITQLVKRIYCDKIAKDTLDYMLINEKTKAYIELLGDTTAKKIAYLDTQTQDDIERDMTWEGTAVFIMEYNYKGRLRYVNCIKDSVNNMSYYVFKGNDISFSRNMEGYFYFDSIFHLKKIYNDESVLIYSVN